MKKISVAEILKSKAPGVSKWIPRAVVRWIERTIRQDEINHVLETYDTGDPFEFLRGFFAYAGVSYEAVGLDRLAPGGRYIFASNHPFGGMDGMMLAEVLGGYFGDVRVVVNDILMFLDPLAGIFVPVNKHGSQKGDYARRFNEAFEGLAPVLTFPAGLCSRREKDGEICDIDWRPNFIKRAEQTDRLIVPVYVEGRLSSRFYRVAEWRKRLGIKVNIEMVLLPDEMFRQKGNHFRLVFGEPVSVDRLRTAVEDGFFEQAREVKRRSYALAIEK
ncbi:MAG: acyltransferase [Alistipes sp.]|jgi:putative hemolysin|nr:acyltransferase [Alistipes sp.]